MKNMRCILLFLAVALWSCDDGPNLNPDGFTEFVTNIDGTWKIDQVLQNGNDITNSVDFGSFSLLLNYENGMPSTYALSDLSTPFVLTEASGNWSFDDATYPTLISFSDGTNLSIEGALLSGSNQLTVHVPLGCGTNTYIYRLTK